jgi:phospholipid transport system substrate-binding protein
LHFWPFSCVALDAGGHHPELPFPGAEQTIVRVLVLTLLLAATARAETATEALKARDAEIRAALPKAGTEPSPAVRKRLESIVTRSVDLEGMARQAMGKSWNETSPAKRRKVIDSFVNRFRKATGEQLDQYRSTEVTYFPEKKEDAEVVVPTEVKVKGEPTHIEYRMREENGDWRIVDIVVDDVSTVDNYRSSFNRIIKKEGVDGLISRLSGESKKGVGGGNGSSR